MALGTQATACVTGRVKAMHIGCQRCRREVRVSRYASLRARRRVCLQRLRTSSSSHSVAACVLSGCVGWSAWRGCLLLPVCFCLRLEYPSFYRSFFRLRLLKRQCARSSSRICSVSSVSDGINVKTCSRTGAYLVFLDFTSFLFLRLFSFRCLLLKGAVIVGVTLICSHAYAGETL